jgi:hypothetical protein
VQTIPDSYSNYINATKLECEMEREKDNMLNEVINAYAIKIMNDNVD